jgi:hypothetical protein
MFNKKPLTNVEGYVILQTQYGEQTWNEYHL